MSLANEASLLLIPSGYKSGKVYSVFPTDGDGDFTFSRVDPGTRVGAGGLIETISSNIPRLDYSNGDCPSLLLEPQRTNDFTYSEEFNQSAWFKSNSTVTTNQITAPDGTLTADLLTSTGSNGGIFRFGIWSTTQKTISFFVKKDTSTTAEIYNASSPTNRVLFNLDNGTITTQGGTMTGKIKDFGSGWFRISATHTATGNQTFGIKPQTNQRIFIWGAQSENASYSTSYIKTIVQIQSRQKDICINGGDADLFNITEGTFFVDVTPFKASTFHRITLSNNTSNEEIIILFYSNNTHVQIISESAGAGQVSYTTNITFDTKNKIAFTFKNNEFKFYVNGSLRHTDTSGNIATGLNSLHFAGNNGGFNYFQGKVHDTRVYDRVLTQAEAVELTTL
jgi:hypothetical protein